MEKNTLNGFEAIFDALTPNVGRKTEEVKENNLSDILDGAGEEMTDEELEALRNPKPDKKGKQAKEEIEDEEDDDDIEEQEEEELEEEVKAKPTKKTKKEVIVEEEEDEDDNEGDEVITSFFDSLSEQLGWDDVKDEEKPRTAEDLIDYFKEVIEENSTPQYASEEVEKLDEFVRNGGNLKDYYSIDADLDLDSIELEDEEVNQKLVLKEFLKEKGYSAKSIDKKIAKYDEAGILEDEATDALEALREIKTQRKEELLANQEKKAQQAKKEQQEFFQNVVTEIKGMDSIYGVNVPEKDKKALLEYIFKPDANGLTNYQKDYAKSLKNLISSAYFTMKGDTLIDVAKKKGKRDALDNFKNTLNGKNNGVNKRSKRQILNDEGSSSIWNTFARQLRAA